MLSLISKSNLDLRKQILLELYQVNDELSYDELVDKLEIKIRKRLTDSMTVLRKKMLVVQTDNRVKISELGSILIKNFLNDHPLH